MKRPTCGTCPYFFAWNNDDNEGQCKRNAPSPKLIDEDKDLYPTWAIMSGDYDWCGEHPDFNKASISPPTEGTS